MSNRSNGISRPSSHSPNRAGDLYRRSRAASISFNSREASVRWIHPATRKLCRSESAGEAGISEGLRMLLDWAERSATIRSRADRRARSSSSVSRMSALLVVSDRFNLRYSSFITT